MAKRGKDEDSTKNKTKKNKKTRTNDLLDVGNGGLPKEIGHKHREKKRKSESNGDGDEARHENDGLQKKRKRDSSKNKHPSKKEQIKGNEQGPAGEGDCDQKPRKENKRKHKHHSQERELENDGVYFYIGVSEGEKSAYNGKSSSDKDITTIKNDVFGADKKNNERGDKKSDAKQKKKSGDGKGIEISREECEGDICEKTYKKKKKKIDGQNSTAEMHEIMTEESGKEVSSSQDEHLVGGSSKSLIFGQKEKGQVSQKQFGKPNAKGKSKRVSFSGHVEVFPSSGKHKSKEDGLVLGKRFTPEEDAILKEAVLNYIEAHGSGDNGFNIFLDCRSHPELKKCWQEIATCIPYCPSFAIKRRACSLFVRAEQCSWTPEERVFAEIPKKKNGNKWKMAAEQLGKSRCQVSHSWRRVKVMNPKTGRWTQEECQSLYDLVNQDLRAKLICEEKKSKHGILRDDIRWSIISDKLSTRNDAHCCRKWYHQLTSSLVAEKKWADAGDYRLIGALYELDAVCVEDVDLDSLLGHRSGEVCRKRWNQMVRRIGHHGSKPFAEQVDTLAMRYVPDLAETREAWDNKPVIP